MPPLATPCRPSPRQASRPAVVFALALAACAGPDASEANAWEPYLPRRASAARDHVQGIIGITQFATGTTVAAPGTNVVNDGAQTFPMLGGSFQHAMTDGEIRLGIEGGLSGGWQSTRTVLAAGNGTIVTQRSNDVLLLDGFVGAYASIPLEGGWRVYGGAGPVLQYASIKSLDLDQPTGSERDAYDGVGGGWYARAGVELEVGGPLLVGFGVRWVDAYAYLGPDFRDLIVEGVQFGFTVSQSY